MQNLEPKITNYSDYRSFLRDYYLFRRTITPKWGFAQWAMELGMKCPSLLNMIVKKRRHASPQMIATLISGLQMNEMESDRLRNLVRKQREPVLIGIHQENVQGQTGLIKNI